MVEELLDLLHRTRQHHAIEHATLHVMLGRRPYRKVLSGYSDPYGFTILGETDEESVRRGVGDALVRLQAGEKQLAVHPNCGTNFVTTAVLVTITALTTTRRTNRFERFALTLLWVLPMLVAGKALGMWLQRYTTCAEVSDRWVADIVPVNIGTMRAYRVLFD
ncbi:MAG: hypothetical protein KDE19_12645 [Caldilineaceae bacterium]|nr:hypothetical protein [Caldilineaceae bacterium]